MSESDRQFSLRSMFVLIAVLTLPLTLLHYWPPTLEFLGFAAGFGGGILALVVGATLLVVAPLAAIIALAVWWNRRSQKATFSGLVLRVVVISVGVYELILLWAHFLT